MPLKTLALLTSDETEDFISSHRKILPAYEIETQILDELSEKLLSDIDLSSRPYAFLHHETSRDLASRVTAPVKVLKYVRPNSTPAGVVSYLAVRDGRAPFTFTGRHVAWYGKPE